MFSLIGFCVVVYFVAKFVYKRGYNVGYIQGHVDGANFLPPNPNRERQHFL